MEEARSGGPPLTARPPDPEVAEKATGRRFSAEYKGRVLEEAEGPPQ